MSHSTPAGELSERWTRNVPPGGRAPLKEPWNAAEYVLVKFSPFQSPVPELEKVPYVVVYGDRESEESLAIRERHGAQSTKGLDELVRELATLKA